MVQIPSPDRLPLSPTPDHPRPPYPSSPPPGSPHAPAFVGILAAPGHACHALCGDQPLLSPRSRHFKTLKRAFFFLLCRLAEGSDLPAHPRCSIKVTVKGNASIFSCKHKTGGTGWGGETGQQEISFHPKIRCPGCQDEPRRPGVGAVLLQHFAPTLPRPAPFRSSPALPAHPLDPCGHVTIIPTLGYRPRPKRTVEAGPRPSPWSSGAGAGAGIVGRGAGLGRWRLPSLLNWRAGFLLHGAGPPRPARTPSGGHPELMIIFGGGNEGIADELHVYTTGRRGGGLLRPSPAGSRGGGGGDGGGGRGPDSCHRRVTAFSGTGGEDCGSAGWPRSRSVSGRSAVSPVALGRNRPRERGAPASLADGRGRPLPARANAAGGRRREKDCFHLAWASSRSLACPKPLRSSRQNPNSKRALLGAFPPLVFSFLRRKRI